ncbi:MAG: hypothetical protein WC511_00705 [Candidatus Pacearchaeota archaeon]
MANEKDAKNKFNYDANILGYAQVAEEYLSQGTREGVALAGKALELILKDVEKSQVLPSWIKSTLTNPEVIHKTIESQLSDYSEFKGKQTVGDLIGQYSNDISKYLGDNAEAAKKELESFKDEKYSSILKKIKTAKDMLALKKDGSDKISDEDAAGAEKTIKKYKNLTSTFSMLEGLYLSKFKARVEEEVVKENFKEMYKPKEENK